MTKNYINRSFLVLGSVFMLTACRTVNNANNKRQSANEGTVLNSTKTKQIDGNLDKIFANFGNGEEQIKLRKELLMSMSKPGENIFKDVADRKDRKSKGIKLPGERSGIEEMAEYRRDITMPIGTDKMLYKDGYLLKEYNEALKSQTLKNAQNKGFTSRTSTYSSTNVVWTERGPKNIPGRDRSIVPSPTNPNKWYVGSVGGGVWITENGGANWRNTTDYSVPSLATSTIAISANNPNIVYAGTGEPFGNLDGLTGVGLIKSTDGGETWTRLTNTVDFGSVGRLLVNQANANHLLVGTSKGIYLTTDGGANWTKTSSGSGKNTNVQDLQASNDFSAIYASVNTYGVLKSTDGGATWNLVFDAIAKTGKSLKRMELGVSPTDNNRLFISAESAVDSPTIALYKSDDAGTTFTELTYKTSDSKEILSTQGWYDNMVAFNPFNKDVVYVGGVYVAKVSIDNTDNSYTVLQIGSGYTANKLNTYVHPDQHGLVCQVSTTDPTKFRMLLTNDGGVYYTDYKTNPGETQGDWIGPVSGLNTTQFYGADKKKGEDAYLGGAQDNGSSATQTAPSSASSSFLPLLGGDGFEVIWNYKDPKKLLFGSQYNNFVVSKNGVTTTGLAYARNADYGSANSPFYSKLANANNNPDVVFTVSSKGVWRTPDFGTTWTNTAFTSAVNGTWLGNASYATVKVSPANPNVVWAGSAVSAGEGTIYKINVSKDNGQTFAKTTGSFPTTGNYYISGLATSHTNPMRAYTLFSAAGQPKIVKTNDYGATWTDITNFNAGASTNGFPNVSVHSVLEMPFDENVIWAGTDIGIFETVDAGASWYLLTAFPPVSVWDMKVVDDQVILATHGRGVWTATIPELRDYVLPHYVGPPTVVSAVQAGIHEMKAKAVFNYTDTGITSLKVYVDNVYVSTIAGTTANTNYNFVSADLAEGVHTISVAGLHNSETEETIKSTKNVEIIAFNAGAENVNIPTFATTDIYVGAGKFVVDNVSAKFTYNVLNNSGHPYANNTLYQTYLRTPIIVGSQSKQDITQMVLTEGKYDYAYVEASKDLVTWVPVGIYDETTDAAWNNVLAANVNESLFKTSIVDYTSKFAAGDEVAVRFRLTTDPADTRFGWLIKSLVPSATLAADEVQVKGVNAVLAPNPVLDETSLYLPTSVKGKVTIAIFDASGKQVSTLERNASSKIDIDARTLGRGVYLVLVKADNYTTALKMLKQ